MNCAASPEMSNTVVADERARTVTVTRSTPIDADRSEDHLWWPQTNGVGRTGGRHETSDGDRGARSSETSVVDVNERARTPNVTRSTW